MADERSRPSDSGKALISAGSGHMPSGVGAAQPLSSQGEGSGDGGLPRHFLADGKAAPRSATIRLPDADRDPSCVRAQAEPAPDTRSPNFKLMRTTQRLGTVPVWTAAALGSAAGANAPAKAGRDAAARPVRRDAVEPTAERSDLPGRSIARSRPWAEVPDPAGTGIRVLPELEAASRDLDSAPREASKRLNARGRVVESSRASSMSGRERRSPSPSTLAGERPSRSLSHRPMARGRSARAEVEDDDLDIKRNLQNNSAPLRSRVGVARRPPLLRRYRTIGSVGYLGAIFVLIGAGVWMWNASPASAPARDAAHPALSTAPSGHRAETKTVVNHEPPPEITASSVASAGPVTTVDPDVLATSPPSQTFTPPRSRPPQKPSKSGTEIVDPWEKSRSK